MTTRSVRDVLGLFDADAAGRAYAGVGSRRTPSDVGVLMAAFAGVVAARGWTLRSGGADGADMAFESGAAGQAPKEIYLPYPRFNGSRSGLSEIHPQAYEIARRVHGGWANCSDFARRAHARNAHQILGRDLAQPVCAVICWTPDGAIDKGSAHGAGGTRTAICLAAERGIPVLNLHRDEVRSALEAWLPAEAVALARRVVVMRGKTNQPPAARSEPSLAPQPTPASSRRVQFRKC